MHKKKVHDLVTKMKIWISGEKMEKIEKIKRIDGLDLMKTIAIMMVLMLHTSLWDTDFINNPSRGRVIQYAFRMISEGVPMFVFVNGFLLFRKNTLDLKKHYYKIMKLIFLTLIWGLILTLIGLKTRAPQEDITVEKVVHYILTIQVGTPYTGFLWFLQNLAGLYLVFPMLKVVYDNAFGLFEKLFVIAMTFTVGVNVLQVVGEFIVNQKALDVFNELLFFINRYNPIGNNWYIFYFMLGAIAMHYFEKISEHRALLIGGGFAAWGVNVAISLYLSKKTNIVYDGALFYRTIFFMFILAILAITMTYQNNKRIMGKIIASIGKNTMGIYLLHTAVINLIIFYWWPITFIGRMFVYMMVFTISWFASIVLKKVPIIHYLFEL